MNEIEKFRKDVEQNIAAQRRDADVQALSRLWMRLTAQSKYSYNFRWLGRPIIQFPQDMVAIQELIWDIKPQVIVETGIAHGGSLIFHASILELLGGAREVIGVDIDIRAHNRAEIEAHPLAKRITMFQGSSIDPGIVEQVKSRIAGRGPVLVILDSNHTHDHVLAELQAYSPLVGRGSHLVVFDTLIDDMPAGFFPDRPWGPGDNPKTAVKAFLKTTDRFEVDQDLQAKLLITVAPEGYLRCVKD
jgi:cephalosporin hydroxylase